MIEKLRNRFAKLSELPEEVVLNVPLIAMTGNKSLSIENYKGIIEYSEENVRINTTIGILKVSGRKLYLNQINPEAIRITGTILKAEFQV